MQLNRRLYFPKYDHSQNSFCLSSNWKRRKNMTHRNIRHKFTGKFENALGCSFGSKWYNSSAAQLLAELVWKSPTIFIFSVHSERDTAPQSFKVNDELASPAAHHSIHHPVWGYVEIHYLTGFQRIDLEF